MDHYDADDWFTGLGKKRAILAVARAILVSALHMLFGNDPYPQLGAHDFDEHPYHEQVDRLARRMEHLGYWVNLQLLTTA